METIYNQRGTTVYKFVMMVAVVVAIIVLVILFRKSAKIERRSPQLDRQAQDSGVNLEEFK